MVEPRDSVPHRFAETRFYIEPYDVIRQNLQPLRLASFTESDLDMLKRVVQVIGAVGHDQQRSWSDMLNEVFGRPYQDVLHRLEQDVVPESRQQPLRLGHKV